LISPVIGVEGGFVWKQFEIKKVEEKKWHLYEDE